MMLIIGIKVPSSILCVEIFGQELSEEMLSRKRGRRLMLEAMSRLVNEWPSGGCASCE